MKPPALLSESNHKTLKGRAKGYRTAALMLAPADLARPGKSICPFSTPACRAECLNTAGNGRFSSVQRARVRRTLFLLDSPAAFREQLAIELMGFAFSCRLSRHKAAVRLNCLSDLSVENWKTGGGRIMEEFHWVQFYDYTKSWPRFQRYLSGEMPKNYHLTFSRSELTPDWLVESAIEQGGNVAIPARDRDAIEEHWPGVPIVDGEEHDLTFLRPRGSIVRLKPKGRAMRDTSGFVLRSDD